MTGPPASSEGSSAPYVGLRPFRVEDNDRFFGRAKESHEVAALWRANKLTVLYGPSGVGKTSLLQAGVIPLLDPERTDLLPIGRVTGAAVASVGSSPGNVYTSALLSSWAPDRSPRELADLPIKTFLKQRPKSSDRYGDPKPILLAIDHAEELFGDLAYRPELVSKFIAGLAQALRSHRETRLLLMVREDRLPSVLGYERILGPVTCPLPAAPVWRECRSGSHQQTAGRHWPAFSAWSGQTTGQEPPDPDGHQCRGREGAACGGCRGPDPDSGRLFWTVGVLPPSAHVITSAHVRRHANIDQFLANYVSRVLSAVAAEHGVEVARIRSWLEQTFITELGTRGTAYEGLEQTAGMPNAAVRSLEDRHLIKAEHRAGIRWYELQHDRLIEPLHQAHPVELLETAELELADGRFNLAKRHADQAARACGRKI